MSAGDGSSSTAGATETGQPPPLPGEASTGGDSTSTDADGTSTGEPMADDTSTGATTTEAACELANPPTLRVFTGRAFPRSIPAAVWTSPQRGCAPTVAYEIAVGTVAGADNLMPFTNIGFTNVWDGTLLSGGPLPDSEALFFSVRAIDALDNVSTSFSALFEIWSPGELPALALWIDAADPDTVYVDAGCTNPAAADDLVACVLDKSGNGNHAGLLAGVLAPHYRTAALGGLPALDLSGAVGLVIENAATLSPGNALTFAGLDSPVDVSDTAVTHSLLHKNGSYQFAYFNLHMFAAVNTAAAGGLNWGAPPAPTAPGLQFNIFEHDDSVWRFRRDGQALGEIPPINGQVGAVLDTGDPVRLGFRGSPGSLNTSYEGMIGELVMSTAVLEPEDTANLERYMFEKWSEQ